MTSQTKQFIELDDILSFRFECPKCHCSTSIPIKEFIAVPRTCPNGCGAEWEQIGARGVTEAFNELLGAMKLVASRTSQLKLGISLEIVEQKTATT